MKKPKIPTDNFFEHLADKNSELRTKIFLTGATFRLNVEVNAYKLSEVSNKFSSPISIPKNSIVMQSAELLQREKHLVIPVLFEGGRYFIYPNGYSLQFIG